MAAPVFRALRHRDFRLFLIGQVISLCGTWMQGLALSWLVYRLTKSTVLMGTIGFCSTIPVLLLSPIAGLAADRYSRRRLVMAAQGAFLMQALALAVLTLTDRVSIPALIGLVLAFGTINAFDIPARQSLYILLVGREDLSNAIALNSMTFNTARVVGPAVGGFIVAAFGEGLCFLFNALTYVGVLVSLFLMRPAEQPREADADPLGHLREGFRYAWNSPLLRVLLTLTAIANIATTPINTLGPVFADRIFGKGSHGLGMLIGALGLGAVIGTAELTRHPGTDRFLARAILFSAVGSTVALAVYSLSPSFGVSLAAMAVLGMSLFRQLAASNSLIQQSIPDEYRGRIMSLYSMTVVGVLPIGNFLSGAAAEWIGVRATVMAGAFMSLAAAAMWFRARPLSLR